MEKKRLLTITEASAHTGITPHALRTAIRRGTLKGQKVGPLYLVASTELDAYKARTGGKGGRPRKQKERGEE